jgi:hypothetical protein
MTFGDDGNAPKPELVALTSTFDLLELSNKATMRP